MTLFSADATQCIETVQPEETSLEATNQVPVIVSTARPEVTLGKQLKKLIVGDSILQGLLHIKNTTTVCLSGATISSVQDYINKHQQFVMDFDVIVFHIGTNNVGNYQPVHNILDSYTNLYYCTREVNDNAVIVFSAMIPRAGDEEPNLAICNINSSLQELCHNIWRSPFLRIFTQFRCGNFIRNEFYRFNSGYPGLHLNDFGSRRLTQYFRAQLSDKNIAIILDKIQRYIR